MASSSVVGLEAVGARQIENAQRAAVRRGAFAFAAFDGDARVVSDLLAAAGESIEERGLAAIGNADQRDAQRRRGNERRPSADARRARRWCPSAPAARAPPVDCRGAVTRTAAASARRKANVEPPMRTTSGSPAGHMRAMTSQCAPATKPRSRRRASRIAALPCPIIEPGDFGESGHEADSPRRRSASGTGAGRRGNRAISQAEVWVVGRRM